MILYYVLRWGREWGNQGKLVINKQKKYKTLFFKIIDIQELFKADEECYENCISLNEKECKLIQK